MKLVKKSPVMLKITGLIITLFLGACAGVAVQPESLGDRAQARWDALLAQDFEKAYSYLSPGYRSSVSSRDFEIGFLLRRVGYTSAEYIDSECQNDACDVSMKIGYMIIAPLRGVNVWNSKTTIEEKWIRIDNQWWHLPKK